MRKIKVCHLTSVHGAYDPRIYRKECRSLHKAGYEVNLVVANAKDEEIGGVRIWGVSCAVRNRIQRMTKVAKLVYEKARDLNADIYHVHDPELLPYAYALKRKCKGCKVIFDSHEDILSIVEEKEYLAPWMRRIIQWLLNRVQVFILRRLDGLISVTPIICDKLLKYNSNTVMCANFPLLDMDIHPLKQSGVIHRNLVFAGLISAQWCHKYLVQAIEDIDCMYYLAGTSDDDTLSILQSMKAWGKVDYKGRIPYEQVWELYGQSDIGMALLQPSNNTGWMTGTLGNTKLFEYMMAGLPVVCTDFVLWKNIVETEQCGICVSPMDTAAVSRAINYLLEHLDEARRMGRNGHAAIVREYNWNTQEKVLLELYARLTNVLKDRV